MLSEDLENRLPTLWYKTLTSRGVAFGIITSNSSVSICSSHIDCKTVSSNMVARKRAADRWSDGVLLQWRPCDSCFERNMLGYRTVNCYEKHMLDIFNFFQADSGIFRCFALSMLYLNRISSNEHRYDARSSSALPQTVRVVFPAETICLAMTTAARRLIKMNEKYVNKIKKI